MIERQSKPSKGHVHLFYLPKIESITFSYEYLCSIKLTQLPVEVIIIIYHLQDIHCQTKTIRMPQRTTIRPLLSPVTSPIHLIRDNNHLDGTSVLPNDLFLNTVVCIGTCLVDVLCKLGLNFSEIFVSAGRRFIENLVIAASHACDGPLQIQTLISENIKHFNNLTWWAPFHLISRVPTDDEIAIIISPYLELRNT